jgi:REP element-mobilizing transposase RayT
MENYYRRHLPHYQPIGATYFVTFRLAGSVPAKVYERQRREKEELRKRLQAAKTQSQRLSVLQQHFKEYFYSFDIVLNRAAGGPRWLCKPEIAGIVEESIRFRDGTKYDLYSHCIMPNHVHMVFKLLGEGREGPIESDGNDSADTDWSRSLHPVTDILASLKKHSALEANRILGRRGAFWKGESYDHVVRDSEELERIIRYVLLNPVKAGLVKSWRDWKWSYCKAGLISL